MLDEFWLFIRADRSRRHWFPSPLQHRCRLTTQRSISTTATAQAPMSAGTSAASANSPPSSATPIAKRSMPRRPTPKREAGVGKSSIGLPVIAPRDMTRPSVSSSATRWLAELNLFHYPGRGLPLSPSWKGGSGLRRCSRQRSHEFHRSVLGQYPTRAEPDRLEWLGHKKQIGRI